MRRRKWSVPGRVKFMLGIMFISAVVAASPGALAQEAHDVNAQCCMCASLYDLEDKEGFLREYVGLCGTCGANYEVNFGSLEDAAKSLKDQIHDLGVKGRQKHSAYGQAVQEWDGQWNKLWGTTHDGISTGGTVVEFGNALVAMALLRPGASKYLQYVNTGMSLRQAPQDWTNWTGLGLDLFADEDVGGQFLDRQYQAVLAEEWRIYKSTGDSKSYIETLKSLQPRYHKQAAEYAKQARGATFISGAIDVIGYAQACDSLSENLTDWAVARKEAMRLKEEIEQIEAQIDGLTRERLCILAEVQNRQNRNAGDDPNDRERRGGPRAWPPQEPLDADPEQPIRFGPLPKPDPTQPDEMVCGRPASALKSLQEKNELTQDLLENSLIPFLLTAATVEMKPEDAPLVAAVCAELQPIAERYDTTHAEVIREGRKILQQFHQDTYYLQRTPEGQQRFTFFRSFMKIDAADWVPGFDQWGWTGIAPSGAGGGGRVDIESANGVRLVPAGTYDVLWVPGFAQRDQPIVVARSIEIKEGQHFDINVNSGARIQAAPWVPPIDGNWGWWGAVPSDANHSWRDRINWHKDGAVPLVLPPGNYDVYWAQGLHQRDRPVCVAKNIAISRGELKTIDVATGVSLELPAGISMDREWGWWAVVPPGGGDDQWINYCRGTVDAPLLVPPGTYEILCQLQINSPVVRFEQRVIVGEHELVKVRFPR